MRVADYIFNYLADYGVKHAFIVVGGGAMHLNDALKKNGRITPICCHNEQSCAIAGEGYFRATGKLPVICVSSGPAGTNALTGVLGAYLDSIPLICLSGQVKQTTLKIGDLRQLGDQEADIISMVRPITKYATMVTDPEMIDMELNMALDAATTGRKGPVWLDIVSNVQSAPYL